MSLVSFNNINKFKGFVKVVWNTLCLCGFREPELLPTSGFLVIQTPTDKPPAQNPAHNTGGAISPQGGMAGQTGRGASVVSQPNLSLSLFPLYLYSSVVFQIIDDLLLIISLGLKIIILIIFLGVKNK